MIKKIALVVVVLVVALLAYATTRPDTLHVQRAGRRLPAFALDPGRYVSIKPDKKCAELASGPRACSATKKRFG